MWFMGSGLKSAHPRKKYKNYKIASVFLVIALVSALLVLILYPVFFYKDLNTENNNPVLDGTNVTRAAFVDNVTETEELESVSLPEVVEDGDDLDASGESLLRIRRQEESDGLLPDEQNENLALNGNDDEGPRRKIEDFSFGFGYGCTLVSAIFILIGVLIVICDQKHEEIYYKEVSIAISEVQEVNE